VQSEFWIQIFEEVDKLSNMDKFDIMKFIVNEDELIGEN